MFPTVDTEEISQVTSLKGKPGACSDERDSSENTQVSESSSTMDLTLNMLFNSLTVVCFALALSVYGAIHNFPPKTSRVSQAVRFFSPDSVVTDWYRGELGNALAAIYLKEVSFVMFYAPWDAESQYVRGEFEKAANILKGRVNFFAINCWSPGSECRNHHTNIYSWPVLISYSVGFNGVLYKGPRNAESIINFLELIMRPLKRISSTEDLVSLLSIYDAVAVGYTPLTETSKYYNVWYKVALESLEFDTIGEICFAVVTSPHLAVDLGVNTLPSARLMMWNETKEYKVNGETQPWNVSSLMHWVLDNFTQPVARIIPLWRKSYNFDKFADGNPMLILFTPLNPLYEQLPSYALMREIAMEYYSCKNKTDPWVLELIKLQRVQRLIYQQKDHFKFCKEFKFKNPVKRVIPHYTKSVISHNNKYPWINSTQKSQKSGLFDMLLKQGLFSKAMESSDDSVLWSSLSLLQECKSQSLPAEKSFYTNYEQCQSFEHKVNNEVEYELESVETTMLPLEDDPLSPENLLQDSVKHSCKLLQFASELELPVAPPPVSGHVAHVFGLACDTNATLYMLAVDSTRNYHFAESLGIDITKKKDRTAVVILDSKQETQYILAEDYNAKSVRDFIYNYTMGTLRRSLRTHVENTSYTHYYESDNTTNKGEPDENEVQIIDLTTRTFRKVVRTPGMVTLVALCRGACGAAAVRAQLHAARLLRACGAPARAARLDALRHDLPWRYAAHHYPAMLVFTADGSGEADSRALPAHVRVSAGALAALALRSLRAPLRFRVRLALCARQRAFIEKRACLKDIREHITTLIGRNLKYWRQTDNEELRNFLLIRLQYLHQASLHLSLLNVTDLKENSEREKLLLQCLDQLSKHWDIDMTALTRNDTFAIEPR
ncbi:thioredoxin domain-containing protein 11 [Epargyreus clarus]|uniref:thioredoxin domain-containing protein 11 n=1 Tax=Epargyreus clarus TaxID=520877 RepID=UPI003C2D31B7